MSADRVSPSEGRRAYGLKKRPSQDRSRRRVEEILSAARGLIATNGYDAMTTNAIAATAGVPISSLYQYFDAKEDVVAEICRGFEARVLEFVAAELTPAMLRDDLRAFISTLVDGIADIQAANDSFVCVFAGSQTDPVFDSFAGRLRQTLVDALDSILAEAWPWLPSRDRQRLLTIWTVLASSLIAASRASPMRDRTETFNDLREILFDFTARKTAELRHRHENEHGARD